MPQRLLHASYAAAFGDWPPRLMSLRDVAQLVHREKPNLLDVLLMAREWQCEPIVARAVNLAWDELALTRRATASCSGRVASSRRRTSDACSRGTKARRARSRVRSPPCSCCTRREDRLAYLRAIMFPQRSYLVARGFNADRALPARLASDREVMGTRARDPRLPRARARLRARGRRRRARAKYLEWLLDGFDAPPVRRGRLRGGHRPATNRMRVVLRRDGETVAASAIGASVLRREPRAVGQPAARSIRSTRSRAMRAASSVTASRACSRRDMESGKTTLTTGLVAPGYSYLTDEAVAFDWETGEIEPFPKPLSIDPGSQFLFPELAPPPPPAADDGSASTQWQVPPSMFRADAVGGRCRARFVVFPKYAADAPTALEPIDRAEALVELARRTPSGSASSPRRSLDTLSRVDPRGRLLPADRRRSRHCVSADRRTEWRRAAMADRTPGSLDAEFAPTRAASVYTVELDGEAVLLDEHENRLHHLNHTASLLCGRASTANARVQELAREISDELGLPYELVLADAVRVVRELGERGTARRGRGRRAARPGPGMTTVSDGEPHPASARRALAAVARRGRAAAAGRPRRDHAGRHRSGGVAAARRVADRGRPGRGARGCLRLDSGRRGPRPGPRAPRARCRRGVGVRRGQWR